MDVGAKGCSELVPGPTVGLAVVDVTCTADATSLASEVVTSEDEEWAAVEDDGNPAKTLVDAGASATLIVVELWLVVLCLCLCP